MDKPTPKERVQHMRDAITRIERYVKGMDLRAFEADTRTQDAVLSCFMVLGEAVRSVDLDILERHPYPWNIVRAFRNFIAHQYHNIKMERVYHAANDLEKLKTVLDRILETEFP
jgi:uncharacterized protein with HEPN domain